MIQYAAHISVLFSDLDSIAAFVALAAAAIGLCACLAVVLITSRVSLMKAEVVPVSSELELPPRYYNPRARYSGN